MPPQRLAIVGLGRMGSTIDREIRGFPSVTVPFSLASSAKTLPELDLCAGCDVEETRRDTFQTDWKINALYDDYDTMLRQERPDAVAICTPARWHAEMTQAAAEAGVKMIYCEKAMACSLAEADAARQALEKHQVAFNTGVLRRFDERYRHARDLIQKGAIGRVQAIVHYAPATLVHGHVHSIDTILFLAGDPKVRTVWGELRPRDLKLTPRLEKDPQAVYHLELDNGIEATTIPAGNWEFEILGDEGILRGMNNGATWTIRRKGDDKVGTLERIQLPAPGVSATVSCLKDLVDAHREQRPTIGHVGTAHHALEICMAVAESHHAQARVKVSDARRDLYVNHY